MLAGGVIPKFTFTYSGFQFTDTPENVFGIEGPSYTLAPAYKGAAGTYVINPYASPADYVVKSVPGYLYVNPSGTKARSIVPVFSCLEKLLVPVSGYSYVAHFVYTNSNATDLYIPVGKSNIVTGKGKFSPVNQPALFIKGGGTFDVYFDGTLITWSVTSISSGKTVTLSASASSLSPACKTLVKAMALPEEDDTEVIPVAYPNPATDKVTIDAEEITEHSIVTITDVKGTSYNVSILAISDNHLELDTSNLPSGLYIIRIVNGTRFKQFTVVIK
jgi:hypothetical protein